MKTVANLWTLLGYPSAHGEWSLSRKLEAIAEAGFDAVCWAPSEELTTGCLDRNLLFVGGMAASTEDAFPALLRALQRAGCVDVNVQLGESSMLLDQALPLTLSLMRQAHALGLRPAIETHRGTCTETPEKTFALAMAYEQTTGEPLDLSWDFSHFALVKHLLPPQFEARLLDQPALVQRAVQFHFRPFNGHHAQVPITQPNGDLTPEVQAWRPFGKAVMRCWLAGQVDDSRHMLICPELGPVEGGYALSTFANSWEEAKRLREELVLMWREVSSEFETAA